jgi:hypothetical protein
LVGKKYGRFVCIKPENVKLGLWRKLKTKQPTQHKSVLKIFSRFWRLYTYFLSDKNWLF